MKYLHKASKEGKKLCNPVSTEISDSKKLIQQVQNIMIIFPYKNKQAYYFFTVQIQDGSMHLKNRRPV